MERETSSLHLEKEKLQQKNKFQNIQNQKTNIVVFGSPEKGVHEILGGK